jgi:putative multiple sugar transport system permease protein
MGLALVAIMIFFAILTDGMLFMPLNVTNLVLQNSYVFILGMGMLLCILSGGNIDLSVGSIVAFIGALCGNLIVNMGINVWISIGIALLVGLAIGAWQGFWIAVVKIPSFIVTLAGMLVFRGLTLVILNGRTIGPFPESFQAISSGFISDYIYDGELHFITLGLGVIFSIVYIISTIHRSRQSKKYGVDNGSVVLQVIKVLVMLVLINGISWVIASYKGISVIMIILMTLVFIYYIITKHSTFGRHIYAMGGNEKAAKLSGIKTSRVLFSVYVNMALLSALAGIVIAGRLNAASPKAGTGFELDAIAACFIGGASTSGGIGTVFGVIIGALIMGVLNNGMSILGISVDWQQTIKGLVLLFAVAFDILSKSRAKA